MTGHLSLLLEMDMNANLWDLIGQITKQISLDLTVNNFKLFVLCLIFFFVCVFVSQMDQNDYSSG